MRSVVRLDVTLCKPLPKCTIYETHNTSMNELKLITFTIVCVLGKRVITCEVMSESENGDDVVTTPDII